MQKIIVFMGFFLFINTVQAGYVQVMRDSSVYLETSSQSDKLATVTKNEQLIEIDHGQQTNNYWHVRLADGRDGWIYRSRVRYTDYESNSVFTAGSCDNNIKYGLPSAPDKLICRIGYVVGFNYSTLVPDWISMKLTYESVHTNGGKRKNKFLTDISLDEEYQVNESVYKKTGYDRGHMADSSSIDATQLANDQTFLMTNMTPQRPWFNRDVGQHKGVWGGIEDATSCWLQEHEREELYILSGTLFDDTPKKLSNTVSIPKGFWKVILDLETLESISFLIPDQELAKNDIGDAEQYIQTIDTIEDKTNLDLFSILEDNIENLLESKKGSLTDWPLYNRVPVRNSPSLCRKR